jgi:hypothetical protein
MVRLVPQRAGTAAAQAAQSHCPRGDDADIDPGIWRGVDLSRLMPLPGAQGRLLSCTAWASPIDRRSARRSHQRSPSANSPARCSRSQG